MAQRPQEYVTPEGQVTTNSIKGFHGLALKYRGKRVDLNHSNYICKTNMAMCHKVHIRILYFYLHKVSCIESRPTVENHLFMEDGC